MSRWASNVLPGRIRSKRNSRPSPCGHLGEVSHARLGHLGRGAVLLRQSPRVRGAPFPFARRAWIELERAPHDVNRSSVLEAGQRLFEAPLTDVAPGAGNIRPNIHPKPSHAQSVRPFSALSRA